MPSYHSVFNKAEIHQKYCGIPVFEFKEKKTRLYFWFLRKDIDFAILAGSALRPATATYFFVSALALPCHAPALWLSLINFCIIPHKL